MSPLEEETKNLESSKFLTNSQVTFFSLYRLCKMDLGYYVSKFVLFV